MACYIVVTFAILSSVCLTGVQGFGSVAYEYDNVVVDVRADSAHMLVCDDSNLSSRECWCADIDNHYWGVHASATLWVTKCKSTWCTLFAQDPTVQETALRIWTDVCVPAGFIMSGQKVGGTQSSTHTILYKSALRHYRASELFWIGDQSSREPFTPIPSLVSLVERQYFEGILTPLQAFWSVTSVGESSAPAWLAVFDRRRISEETIQTWRLWDIRRNGTAMTEIAEMILRMALDTTRNIARAGLVHQVRCAHNAVFGYPISLRGSDTVVRGIIDAVRAVRAEVPYVWRQMLPHKFICTELLECCDVNAPPFDCCLDALQGTDSSACPHDVTPCVCKVGIMGEGSLDGVVWTAGHVRQQTKVYMALSKKLHALLELLSQALAALELPLRDIHACVSTATPARLLGSVPSGALGYALSAAGEVSTCQPEETVISVRLPLRLQTSAARRLSVSAAFAPGVVYEMGTSTLESFTPVTDGPETSQNPPAVTFVLKEPPTNTTSVSDFVFQINITVFTLSAFDGSHIFYDGVRIIYPSRQAATAASVSQPQALCSPPQSALYCDNTRPCPVGSACDVFNHQCVLDVTTSRPLHWDALQDTIGTCLPFGVDQSIGVTPGASITASSSTWRGVPLSDPGTGVLSSFEVSKQQIDGVSCWQLQLHTPRVKLSAARFADYSEVSIPYDDAMWSEEQTPSGEHSVLCPVLSPPLDVPMGQCAPIEQPSVAFQSCLLGNAPPPNTHMTLAAYCFSLYS